MSANGEKGEITQNFMALQSGDQDAAQPLWDRFFEQLVQLARQRLRSVPRRVADEEDVALSVFQSLCRGAEAGRLDQVANRDELWRLLVSITQRKVVDQIRHLNRAKRGGGQVRGESVWQVDNESDSSGLGIQQIAGDQATPEFICQLEEQHQMLLQRLPNDTLRQVAQGKLEGLTNAEVAERLGLSTRSVERKLQLIRENWQQYLACSL